MKLSIITINRNNAEGLRKTIQSVLSQTYRDFEYIIVDGASDDDSIDVIRIYESVNRSSVHPLNFTWLSEPDSGIYNAMNKGLKMAHGEYTLMLNSGDILQEKDTLKNVFSIPHSEDVFWGKMLYCREDGSKRLNCIDNIDLSVFHSFDCRIPHQSCFIKKELIQSEGYYDENYRIAADHKFLYKAVFVDKKKSAFIDVVVSEMDGNGISSNEALCNEEDDRLFCEFFPPDLLKDYQEWRNLKRENIELESYIKSYKNAIDLYAYIKKWKLLRKFHTLLYKVAISLEKFR